MICFLVASSWACGADLDLVHLLLERVDGLGGDPVEEGEAGQLLDLLDRGPVLRPVVLDRVVVGSPTGSPGIALIPYDLQPELPCFSSGFLRVDAKGSMQFRMRRASRAVGTG